MTKQMLDDYGIEIQVTEDGDRIAVSLQGQTLYCDTIHEARGIVYGFILGFDLGSLPPTVPIKPALPVVSAATVKDALCQVIDCFQGGVIPQVS
jgi:hypothetical protein